MSKRTFCPSFEKNTDQTVHAKYYLPTVEIKPSNVLTDGQNCFNKPVKNSAKTYNNIQKSASGQGDDYTTSY